MKNKRRATPWNRPRATAVAACTGSCPVSSLFLQQFCHTADSIFSPTLSLLVYGATHNSVLGRLIFFVFLDHTQLDTQTHTYASGRTPLNDRSARRIGRYLRNKQQTQETNIHALSGIRTHRSQQSSDIRPTPSPQATGISSFTLQMVTPVAQLAPQFKHSCYTQRNVSSQEQIPKPSYTSEYLHISLVTTRHESQTA
jgi:hypothetical protein